MRPIDHHTGPWRSASCFSQCVTHPWCRPDDSPRTACPRTGPHPGERRTAGRPQRPVQPVAPMACSRRSMTSSSSAPSRPTPPARPDDPLETDSASSAQTTPAAAKPTRRGPNRRAARTTSQLLRPHHPDAFLGASHVPGPRLEGAQRSGWPGRGLAASSDPRPRHLQGYVRTHTVILAACRWASRHFTILLPSRQRCGHSAVRAVHGHPALSATSQSSPPPGGHFRGPK